MISFLKITQDTNISKNNLLQKDWNKIISETKKLGLKIYCDVLGEKAFNFIKKYKIDGYKIHSSDISNINLLNKLSKINKKLFISTGGVKITELYVLLRNLKNFKNEIIFTWFSKLSYKSRRYTTRKNSLFKKRIW